MKTRLLTILFSLLLISVSAQTKYIIDASRAAVPLQQVHFKMGNPGSTENKILLNSQFITIGGKPVIPVMGEMHLTRVPRKNWEETLLKMKAAGVNVIAFYIFWNHHEEIESQFNWSDNYDVRAFVELCKKLNLYAYPRIGPWAHGEARNGGTPDWILRKTQLKDRSNHPVYQNYVKRFFKEIGIQLNGLYYKDKGPIIGIQLENEYWKAKQGEPHIQWLKETAMNEGMDVPLYTVTAWKNGSVPSFEVIPLWGAYPDAPWASHIHKEMSEENFCFDDSRDNEKIGDETVKAKQYMDYSQYPYFTCEMGIGIQNTYHRRLIIGSRDGLTMVTAKLGSGSNLIGYYVFAGGSNPQGTLHAQTEDQEETGYWNHNPDKSYDFQAAIRETGETSDAYREVKKLHYFLSEFGEELAPASPVLAPKKANDMQLAVRVNGNSGFLFGINYCRYLPREARKNVQFEVQLPGETLLFPSKGVTIPDSAVFIWPFNLKLGGVQLRYATAQPLCKLDDIFVFFANNTVRTEFCFDAQNLSSVSFQGKSVGVKDGKFIVSVPKPGKDAVITVKTVNGQSTQWLVLSEPEARQAWLFKDGDKKEFYLSNGDLYMNDGKLNLITQTSQTSIFKYGAPDKLKVGGKLLKATSEGLFTRYEVEIPVRKIKLNAEPKTILADAEWLQSNDEEKLSDKRIMFHRFFLKEFSLENTSRIRSAILYLGSESAGRLNVNNRWVAQKISPNVINEIDLSAYVEKGENKLYLDFPLTEGTKAFAGRIVVEYYNTQRIEFSTDQSWLTKDLYSYPSELRPAGEFAAPKLVTVPPVFAGADLNDRKEWSIPIPFGVFEGVQSVYLSLSYTGDLGQLYLGHQLMADNFNSNEPWRIALNRLDFSPEGRALKLIITPAHYTRLFQDKPTPASEIGKALINKLKVETDYRVVLEY